MSMMKMMAIDNSKTGTGRDMMAMMGKSNSLLDKIINMLSWNNSADLYMQRYIQMFNPNHNPNHSKVLEDHGEKEEIGKHKLTEIVTGGDTVTPKIVVPLAK